MNVKEIRQQETDLAWGRLCSRLEGEDLIPGRERRKKPLYPGRIFRYGIAAVLFVGCCVFLIRMLLPSASSPLKEEMLMMRTEGLNKAVVNTLADGSVVYLRNETTLRYPKQFEEYKREVFLEGDAFFDIKKDKNSPFLIQTPVVSIRVLGTSFYVESSAEQVFSLTVRSGEVEVLLRESDRNVRVKSGQTVRLKEGSLQLAPTADINPDLSYLELMHFKDWRLGELIPVINRVSNGKSIVFDEKIKDLTLTATFRTSDAMDIASYLCVVMGLELEEEAEVIRLFDPEM